MENFELNVEAVRVLEEWDPLRIGAGNYATEAADVVAALQSISDAEQLAEVIQTVYEYSFEQWIPKEQCVHMANKLIQLRHKATCTI